MDSVVVTIEYSAGGRRVRRRLARQWPCPLCSSTLEAEPGQPASQVKRLICPGCRGAFRIVDVETRKPPRGR